MALSGFALWQIAAIVVVIAAAGFVHGVIGFGFPIIAMPLLAALFDTKSAVLLTVVPILVLAAISSFRGGGLRQSLGRFWYLPIFTAAGGYAGTRLFLVVPTLALTLLLAAFILIYLLLDRFGPRNFPFVRAHWAVSGAIAAFLAAITETTVNIGAPLMLIYFMLAGVEPLTMVQSLNFVFLISKIIQIGMLFGSGALTAETSALQLPLVAVAAGPLFAGMRIRDRLDVATYRRAVRGFLWFAVALLLARAAYGA